MEVKDDKGMRLSGQAHLVWSISVPEKNILITWPAKVGPYPTQERGEEGLLEKDERAAWFEMGCANSSSARPQFLTSQRFVLGWFGFSSRAGRA